MVFSHNQHTFIHFGLTSQTSTQHFAVLKIIAVTYEQLNKKIKKVIYFADF